MRSAVEPQPALCAGRVRLCRLSHAVILLAACFCFAPQAQAQADRGERFLEALSYVPIGKDGLKAALPVAYVDLEAIEAAFGLEPPAKLAKLNWHDTFNFVRSYSNRALFFFGTMDKHPAYLFYDFWRYWRIGVEDWRDITSFDIADIAIVLYSGRDNWFDNKLAIVLGRSDKIQAEDTKNALLTAGVVAGSVESFWKIHHLIPSMLRKFHPYSWASPRDGGLLITADEEAVADVLRLDEGKLPSLADHPLVQAAVDSVYLNQEWPQPFANACFNIVGRMTPFDDVVSILYPVSAMPPSPLTLVAEQLGTGLGRLSLVATYQHESDAEAALHALESRVRRLPASMVDGRSNWWDGVRFAPLPAEGKASRFRPTLLEVLDATMESRLYDGRSGEGVWAASVSLVYPVTPLESLPKGSRFEDRSINALHIRPVSYQCRFGFLPFVSHLQERDRMATAGRRAF